MYYHECCSARGGVDTSLHGPEQEQNTCYVPLGESRRNVVVPVKENGTQIEVAVSLPCQLYKLINQVDTYSESGTRPLRSVIVCGGYGETDPKRTLAPYLGVLSQSSDPPDIVVLMSMPGNLPEARDREIFEKYPQAFGLPHYHQVMQHTLIQIASQIVRENIATISQNMKTSLQMGVIAHSAACHALDQNPGHYQSKNEPRRPLELQISHQNAIQSALSDYHIEVSLKQVALAPCDRLAWWLGYLAKVLIPTFEGFKWGFSIDGASVLKIFRIICKAAPIPPEWAIRADIWSDPEQVVPELMIYLPHLLHSTRLPTLSQDVLVLLLGNDRVSPDSVIPEHELQAVIDGTHSKTDEATVVEFVLRFMSVDDAGGKYLKS